jgi:hydroxymethylpyrimidine pyrophosphatase-like HAD family hydrolase
MSGFVRAVALDLDGTLTKADSLSETALLEVDRLRGDGLAAVLVTGRIVSELDATFPTIREQFDAVVAENGAVLLIDGTEADLAEPVDGSLEEELATLGISVRRGRVLLAAEARHAEAIVSAAGRLGLDYQVVRNRGALMVLPAGVTKGAGLLVALELLGISPHQRARCRGCRERPCAAPRGRGRSRGRERCAFVA